MTTSIPKLISVVELVKRSYMEQIRANGPKGKHKAVGLWQYNKSGCVSPADIADHQRDDADQDENADTALTRVLLGKSK